MRLSTLTKLSLSVLVSILVLGLFAQFTDLQLLDPRNYPIDWFFLGISSLLFLVNYVCRSVRFQEVLSGDVCFKALLGISAVHGALNYIFPLKAGELSFPLMSRLFLGSTLLESGMALVLCRIFDLALVLVLFVIALSTGDQASEFFLTLGFEQNIPMLVAFSVLLVFGAISVLVIKERVSLSIRINKLLNFTANYNKFSFGKVLVITFLIWLCVLGNFYFLNLSLGYQVPLGAIIMVSIAMAPLSLIPVQGVANMGTFELAWVAGLVMFGFSPAESLDIAIKVHVLLTIQVFGLLSFGLVILGIWKLGERYA